MCQMFFCPVVNRCVLSVIRNETGVYIISMKIRILSDSFQENTVFMTQGQNQKSNFKARMTYGNKKQGILNIQLNIRSLYNKVNEIKMLAKREKPHILGITEAELRKSCHSLDAIKIPGYHLLVPKSWNVFGNARVVVYLKKSLLFEQLDELEHEDTQTIWFRAGFKNSKKIYFSRQYREHTNTLGSSMSSQRRNLEIMLYQWESAVYYDGGVNEVHICGDFNLDTLNGRWLQRDYSLLGLSKMVFNTCKAQNFSQLVDKVTRVQYDSVKGVTMRSCIDHIYCNFKHRVSTPRIISCGASDHDAVAYIRYSKEPTPPKRTIRKRSYKDFNEKNYIEEVSKIDFTGVYSSRDVDTAAKILTDLLVNALNRHAPWIVFQERKNYAPWLTADTANLMKERDILKDSAKSNPDINCQRALWDEYKKLRNKVTNRLKQEEMRFKREKIKACQECPAQTWKVAKRFMDWSSSGAPTQLEITDGGSSVFITRAFEIAKVMNEYFVTKVQNLIQGLQVLPESLEGCHKIMNGRNISLSAKYIPLKKVRKLIKNLKNKTSSSIDQLDNYAIKLVADIIAEPLHHVITLSLMQLQFPACWKLTKIVPLHKKDSILDAKNYRPVAILSPLSKILEKAIYEQIYDYFDRNKLLHSSLHGFRKHRSTTTALLSMYNKWVEAASYGKVTGVVLVDLSAAFDLVSPALLTKKLTIYGLDKSFVSWILSYLTDRHQTVWIDHLYSNFIENSVGVPQGSILGPLFFLIYFNDLPAVIDTDVEGYADDTTMSKSGETLEDVGSSLAIACDSLCKWTKENHCKLNANKTHLLVLRTSNKFKNMPDRLNVPMEGFMLQESVKTSEMLLGVKLQLDLKWTEQISFLSCKLNKRLACLEKLRHIMGVNLRKNIVEGIFNSILCYCLPVFGGCSQHDLKSLQIQQNRAARLVLLAPPRANRNLMFDKLSWLSVNQLIAYHTIIAVFRIRQAKEPEDLAVPLLTDSRQGRIMLKNLRLDLYRNSFVYRGSQLWNRLPQSIRGLEKLSAFKKSAKIWVMANIIRFTD